LNKYHLSKDTITNAVEENKTRRLARVVNALGFKK
jgi:hypothetical protein